MAPRDLGLVCLVLTLAAPALWGADDASTIEGPPRKIEDIEGVTAENLYLDGRVYIAGQPCSSGPTR